MLLNLLKCLFPEYKMIRQRTREGKSSSQGFYGAKTQPVEHENVVAVTHPSDFVLYKRQANYAPSTKSREEKAPAKPMALSEDKSMNLNELLRIYS